MPALTIKRRMSEPQFAALVDEIAADSGRRETLVELLRESHPLYEGRGAATIVRMRGWILLALARTGVSDAALIFVLEELDTGTDPYLVAAAARALRSYPRPDAGFASMVMGALEHIRRRDEPLSFDAYGEYAIESTGISAVGELLATLAWLGRQARDIVTELEALRAPAAGLSHERRLDVSRALQAIGAAGEDADEGQPSCCGASAIDARPADTRLPVSARGRAIGSIVLQDHEGNNVAFSEFFHGRPTIVAFFYTRCANPMKCSLTIAKLARVQGLLEARGLNHSIGTAAITYDPAYDLPDRLRVYGQDRGMRLDAGHRMFRATVRNRALQEYFGLGVNYVGSLVNRHRIELHVLDARGKIAASFDRLRWDEQDVVSRAAEVLERQAAGN